MFNSTNQSRQWSASYPFVGEQITGVGQMPRKHHRAGDISDLAGRQAEGKRSAEVVDYGVNLGVAPTLCIPDGLNRSLPFPPAAERCALTCVLCRWKSLPGPGPTPTSAPQTCTARCLFETSDYSDCKPSYAGRIRRGNPATGNPIEEHE